MNALEKAKQQPDAFEQALADFLDFARSQQHEMNQGQMGSPDDIFAYGKGIPKDAKASNLLPAAELGLSLAPGSGEAMSLRDAWDASGRAAAALERGEYRNALSDYADLATGLLGAVPGAGFIARGTKRGAAWMDRNLPKGVNRLMDAAYPSDPRSTTNIFAGPTAKTADHAVDPKNYDLNVTKESPSGHKDINVIQDGKVVARIQAHLDERGDLFINNIAGYDGDRWTDFKALSNQVGTKGIIQIRNQLKEMFPSIKTLSGDRVGGARAEAMPLVKMKVRPGSGR